MPHDLKHFSAHALLSEEVASRDGHRVGVIKDVVIDFEQGQAAYFIVSMGGMFGIGAKLIALPWRLLRRVGHTIYIDVEKALLDRAPAFDEGAEDFGHVEAVWQGRTPSTTGARVQH